MDADVALAKAAAACVQWSGAVGMTTIPLYLVISPCCQTQLHQVHSSWYAFNASL
jgi:hypothetical protein